MSIAENLRTIQSRIARACDTVGRDPSEVTLVAVSKTFPIEAIRELYDLGHRHFGESRLQEAIPKIEALPKDIVWHFVGKLQSNKARRAAEFVDVIHTLESESQLREIAKANRTDVRHTNPREPIGGLIQVNIAHEPQKSGVLPENLVSFAESVLQYEQIRFHGLMTIGPANPNAEAMRPFYRAMRELLQRIDGRWLSMGMSHDFDVAIQEGATHVRVGTALFGAR
jgi:PLP dependent protein